MVSSGFIWCFILKPQVNKRLSSRTSSDVVVSKDELFGHAAAHADVHLSQQLSPSLTPAVVLWQHGDLQDKDQDVRVGDGDLK